MADNNENGDAVQQRPHQHMKGKCDGGFSYIFSNHFVGNVN